MATIDDKLIAHIQKSNAQVRALLCALARRGKALKQTEPERGQDWLAVSRAHPLYKACRIGFDLLELEDMMLDGPAPTQVDGYFETHSVQAIVDALTRLQRALMDASHAAERSPMDSALGQLALHGGTTLAPEPPPDGGWPALTSSDYLYDLVVLGVLRQFARVLLVAT